VREGRRAASSSGLSPWQRLALCLPFVAALLAYAPDAGQGFVKDDFHWIRTSAVERLADVPDLFSRHTGFYRPLVSLSFAANHAVGGIDPRGYGWTNLALAFAAAALILGLGRALGLGTVPAALAGAAWLLNFHGINMAVLWVSGRTALLLVCCAVAAAWAAARGRRALMGLFCLGALLSKEEAVLLPLILLVIAGTRPSLVPTPHFRFPHRLPSLVTALFAFTPLAIYAWLRSHTGAMTPETAPAFYRFSFGPSTVLSNLLQYADRSSTLCALVALACAAAARFARPPVDSVERRVIVVGLAWLVLGFGLTIFLPVRSSLYACFPSVGSVLVAGALASAWSRVMSDRAQRRLAVALVVVPFLLLPVYRARNGRWTRGATFSARIMSDLAQATASLPAGSLIVLHDEREKRTNLASTFGTLIEDAVVLAAGRPVRAWVDPPVPDAAAAGLTAPTDVPAKELWVVGGRLAATPAPAPR
jgi:hypothetical protein